MGDTESDLDEGSPRQNDLAADLMIGKFGEHCSIDERVPFECIAGVPRAANRVMFAVEPADSLGCRSVPERLLLPRVRRQCDASARIGPGHRFKIGFGTGNNRFGYGTLKWIAIRCISFKDTNRGYGVEIPGQAIDDVLGEKTARTDL